MGHREQETECQENMYFIHGIAHWFIQGSFLVYDLPRTKDFKLDDIDRGICNQILALRLLRQALVKEPALVACPCEGGYEPAPFPF